jgi:hypothetical protein
MFYRHNIGTIDGRVLSSIIRKYNMLLMTWVGNIFIYLFILLSYQNVAHHSLTEQINVFVYLIILDFRKSIVFWKVHGLRHFVLLVRATCN